MHRFASGIVPGTTNYYGYGSGTSYAAPQAAGVGAILSRYFRAQFGGWVTDPSPAMAKAMMVVGGESMNGGTDDLTGFSLGNIPDPVYGWGRLGMQRIFDGTLAIALDEDHGATPVRRFTAGGQFLTFTYTVADASKPIVLALAFTDAAGALFATSPQVNKLNMYVLQGNGIYCDDGPQDEQGYTLRNSFCNFPDIYNNVKRLAIAPNSFAGTFQVRIDAFNVGSTAVPGLDGGSPNQDFALFIYNAQ